MDDWGRNSVIPGLGIGEQRGGRQGGGEDKKKEKKKGEIVKNRNGQNMPFFSKKFSYLFFTACF